MKKIAIVTLIAATTTLTPAYAGKGQDLPHCASILFPGCLDLVITSRLWTLWG
ncbi:MAG: hypothetical protein AAF871_07755 [Pseudomonadota bacterium]